MPKPQALVAMISPTETWNSVVTAFWSGNRDPVLLQQIKDNVILAPNPRVKEQFLDQADEVMKGADAPKGPEDMKGIVPIKTKVKQPSASASALKRGSDMVVTPNDGGNPLGGKFATPGSQTFMFSQQQGAPSKASTNAKRSIEQQLGLGGAPPTKKNRSGAKPTDGKPTDAVDSPADIANEVAEDYDGLGSVPEFVSGKYDLFTKSEPNTKVVEKLTVLAGKPRNEILAAKDNNGQDMKGSILYQVDSKNRKLQHADVAYTLGHLFGIVSELCDSNAALHARVAQLEEAQKRNDEKKTPALPEESVNVHKKEGDDDSDTTY